MKRLQKNVSHHPCDKGILGAGPSIGAKFRTVPKSKDLAPKLAERCMIVVGTMVIKVSTEDEVEPCFRSPCKYVTIGTVQVQVGLA